MSESNEHGRSIDQWTDNEGGKTELVTLDANEAEVETIPSPKFTICQPVLARDKDGLLYDAVVRRLIWGVNQNSQATVGLVNSEEEMEQYLREQSVASWHYFVHYNKWKPNWDRWVREHDLMDSSPENEDLGARILQEHKALQREFKNKSKRKVDGGEFLKSWNLRLQKFAGSSTNKTYAPMKLSKQLWENDYKLGVQQLCLVSGKGSTSRQLVLSFGLKKILVEEWEIINHFQMVHNLPSSVPIRECLNLYLESKGIHCKMLLSSVNPSSVATNRNKETSFGPQHEKHTQEWLDMVGGLVLFFEEALAFRLLYPSERSQFFALRNSDLFRGVEKVDIYGCEFLLRLLSQLPSILDDEYGKENDITKEMLAKLNDFLRFLQKNQSTLFAQSYRKKNTRELSHEQKEAKREDRKRNYLFFKRKK